MFLIRGFRIRVCLPGATRSLIMSQFGQDLGLVHEAVVTGRKVGANERFWATLAHNEEVFKQAVAFVMSLVPMVFCLRPAIKRDMLKEGWKKLEKDSKAKEGEFVSELEEFLTKDDTEGYISGNELEKRIKGRDDLAGQRHLEAMLWDQASIPVEWRNFYLVAPGTVWVYSNGCRDVPYLYWDGKQWVLDFFWIDYFFDSIDRLVRLRK